MSFIVETKKPKLPADGNFPAHLIRVLRDRLDASCVIFTITKDQCVLPGMPGIAIIYGGVTFYLDCKTEADTLSKHQRDTFPKLRHAGARVEVVRNVSEALSRCGEFGIAFKSVESRWTIQSVFKSESNRRPGKTWTA